MYAKRGYAGETAQRRVESHAKPEWCDGALDGWTRERKAIYTGYLGDTSSLPATSHILEVEPMQPRERCAECYRKMATFEALHMLQIMLVKQTLGESMQDASLIRLLQ
ncbi:hypothetical protein KIN20_035842 [Parelaphostrongylus tenuis]|uniref:Uncharacterized protein n=1 Tax=Parelaphostrongylus tenuis TaxID=148309 RepID=A0AAD5WKW1_PARTN|nr:hypothetical protein KIN20_035842 [Parelaphostrongylus tenuis]